MDLLWRLRQSHAVEHATVAVLVERRGGRKLRVAGLSHPWGFILVCPAFASQADVFAAATDAQERLATGQSHLALSDYCGTNLAIAALLVTMVVNLARVTRGSFSRSVMWAAITLALSPVAGQAVQQQLTTDADVHDRTVLGASTIAAWSGGALYHVRLG